MNHPMNFKDKRTNGPVNAHLISGIYSNTFIHVHAYRIRAGGKTSVCYTIALDWISQFRHIGDQI